MVGNIMVIMSVIMNKNLQNTTNLFLMSLAAADFLVAVVVMPIYVLTESIGYFPFGFLVCNIWCSSDIFLCTSSIWHMSTISMDRYFTIKFPFKYGRNKSRKYTFLKITLVWLISILICSSMFALGTLNPLNVYNPVNKICALTNSSFKLYGGVFAFFIPLTIVIVTYAFTMHALKKLMLSKQSILNTDSNYEVNKRKCNRNGEVKTRSKLLSISIMSLKNNPSGTIVISKTVENSSHRKSSNDEQLMLDGYNKQNSSLSIPSSEVGRGCCRDQILKMTNIEGRVSFPDNLTNKNENCVSTTLSFVKVKKSTETSGI